MVSKDLHLQKWLKMGRLKARSTLLRIEKRSSLSSTVWGLGFLFTLAPPSGLTSILASRTAPSGLSATMLFTIAVQSRLYLRFQVSGCGAGCRVPGCRFRVLEFDPTYSVYGLGFGDSG